MREDIQFLFVGYASMSILLISIFCRHNIFFIFFNTTNLLIIFYFTYLIDLIEKQLKEQGE